MHRLLLGLHLNKFAGATDSEAPPYVEPEEEPDAPPVGDPDPPTDTPEDPDTEEPEPGVDPDFVHATRIEVADQKQTVIRTSADPNTWGNAYVAAELEGYDYWEIHVQNSTPRNATLAVGITNMDLPLNGIPGDTAGALAYWSSGVTRINGVDTGGFATFGRGDKISIARDYETGRVWFAKNGDWLGSTPAVAGSGHQGTLLADGPYYPFVALYSTSAEVSFKFITSKFTHDVPDGFYPIGQTPALPLDGLTATGAWSMSRDLLTTFVGGTRYTTATGVNSLNDQTGNARHFTNSGGSQQPAVTTAGPNSRTCADFDGNDDSLGAVALSSLMSSTAGWIVVSCIVDAITVDQGTGSLVYLNNGVCGDAGGYAGLVTRTTGPSVTAFNYDGNYDTLSNTIATGTPYVFTWRHEGGNIYMSVNGGSESLVASGTTSNMSGQFCIGQAYGKGNVKIFEVATFSTIPSSDERDALVADMMDWIGAAEALILDGTTPTFAFSASRDLLTSFVGGTRYIEDSGFLQQARDQSGSARHFHRNESASGEWPTIGTRGVNSRACMVFDGGADRMLSSGTAASAYLNDGDYYAICSFYIDTILGAEQVLIGFKGSTASSRRSLHINATTGAAAVRNNGGAGNQNINDGTVSAGSAHVLEGKLVGSTLSVRLDGGAWTTAASGAVFALSGTSGTANMGGAQTADADNFDGGIFEVATYKTLPSDAQQDAIAADFLAWIS